MKIETKATLELVVTIRLTGDEAGKASGRSLSEISADAKLKAANRIEQLYEKLQEAIKGDFYADIAQVGHPKFTITLTPEEVE